MQTAGVDRLSVLNLAIELVRRGGTISLSGVYGGTADPLNMLQMFDKQLTLKMGQANVRHWIDDIMPLLEGDEDPLGVERLRHAPPAADRGARGVRDVPEEAGRRVQGRLQARDLNVVRVVVTGATGNVGTSVDRRRWWPTSA